MKNIWFNFWSEFDRVFNDPREIHRVMVVMFFSVSLGHVIYVYNSIPVIKWDTSAKLAASLGVVVTVFVLSWCFKSNEMTLDLFNRFIIVGGLSGLFHRMFFYAIELGDPYFVTMAVISFALVGFYAMANKEQRERIGILVRFALSKISKIFIRHEKKDNVHIARNNKSAVNE